MAKAYPKVADCEDYDLMDLLYSIQEATGEKFIFIIDEWDAICREFAPNSKAMDAYVNWLRRMFKDVSGQYVFAGIYMTGILPVKKYKTESALNNFIEYSMVEPFDMAACFGFTKAEVKQLQVKWLMISRIRSNTRATSGRRRMKCGHNNLVFC